MPEGTVARSMESSSRRPGWGADPRELVADRPPPWTARGHLKGALLMPIPATSTPEPDALIPTPVEAAPTEVPVWDLAWDIVDQWGAESFPASDPPANW